MGVNKHLKSRVYAMLTMLIISAVVLVSVGYAWYTISTAPEISKIEARVASNENLEILLDDGYTETTLPLSNEGDYRNPYTWGNLIDVTTANNDNPKPVELAPVKYEGGVLKYPSYGEDGRIISINNVLKHSIISDYEGCGNNGGYRIFYKEDNSATSDALGLTYWLRSNEDCNVLLAGYPTYRADDGINAEETVNAVMGKGGYLAVDFGAEIVEKIDDGANLTVRDYYYSLTESFREWRTAYDSGVDEQALNIASDALLANEIKFNKVNKIFSVTYSFCRYENKEVEEEGEIKTIVVSIPLENKTDAQSAMNYYAFLSNIYRADVIGINFYCPVTEEGLKQATEMIGSFSIRMDVMNYEDTAVAYTLFAVPTAAYYYLPENWESYSVIKYEKSWEQVVSQNGWENIQPGDSRWATYCSSYCYYHPYVQTYNTGHNVEGTSNPEIYLVPKGEIRNMIYYDSIDTLLVFNLILVEAGNTVDAIENYKQFYDVINTDTSQWTEQAQYRWLVGKDAPARDAVPNIPLVADDPVKINTYIYLNGLTATNRTAGLFGGVLTQINLQFENPECRGEAMTASLETS